MLLSIVSIQWKIYEPQYGDKDLAPIPRRHQNYGIIVVVSDVSNIVLVARPNIIIIRKCNS